MDNTETYHQPTHISLCTGYGGLDLGLKRVLPDLRTVAYSEVECAAVELLLARMESGSLDPAPIWSNLRTFPWGAFSDRVDILSGGYPCQPFSAAGKRLGTNDERHLWPFIADGVRILRPKVCFFENVEGHITLGLSTVISDLESMGYKVSFGLFSAAEVGAPHQRKRVFIMANRKDSGLERLRECSASQGRQTQTGHIGGCRDVWPSRPGEPQHWWEPPRVVANTEFIGRRGRSDGDARGLCGEIQTARPCDSGAEPVVGNATNEGQPEWGCREMGQPGTQSQPQRPSGDSDEAECQAEPTLGGGVDGPADWLDYVELCHASDNRTDELRMLGNGVVPATVARAFRVLSAELLDKR